MYQMIPVRRLDMFLDRGFPDTIVDLRSPADYRRSHIRGAINRELESLLENPQEIPCDRPVLFYCARGSESLKASIRFSRMGYQVFDVANGLSYYRGHNLVCGGFSQEPFDPGGKVH